jgi:hypothetical protein
MPGRAGGVAPGGRTATHRVRRPERAKTYGKKREHQADQGLIRASGADFGVTDGVYCVQSWHAMRIGWHVAAASGISVAATVSAE